MRIVGDVVFVSGVAALAWFLIGLRTGWSYRRVEELRPSPRVVARSPAREEDLVGVGSES
jgi:nitric oxide reductase subunit B